MNIVYGGSFNPVTRAHKKIADELIKRFNPEKFIFLPVGNDYNKPELIESSHRLNMLKLLKDGVIDVSDYECCNSYEGTYKTLKNLNLNDVYFVMGYDNLKSLDTWNDYKSLLKEFKIIVVSRPGCFFDDSVIKDYMDNIIVIDDLDLEISSSLFRDTRNFDLLDPRVGEYIKENNLYRK